MFLAKLIHPWRKSVAVMLLGALVLGSAAYGVKPMAILRTPPPSELSSKVNAISYALNADQSLQFLLMFAAGPYGYPTFPGVSRSENAAVLLFESDRVESAYVLLLKVEPGSKFTSNLQDAGLAMSTFGDWTAFAPDSMALSLLQRADPAEVLAAVRQKRRYDFELEVITSSDQIRGLRDQLSSSDSTAEEQAAFDAAFEFINGVEKMTVGVTFGSETFTYALEFDATPGTPEAELLSMPVGGPVPAADYVSALTSAGAIFRVDPEAVRTYFDVVSKRVQPALEPEARASFAKFMSEWDTLFAGWDGTGAYGTSVDADGSDMVIVYGGSWTEDPYAAVLDTMLDETLPALLNGLPIDELAKSMNEAGAQSKHGDTSSADLSSAMGNITAGNSLASIGDYKPLDRAIVNGWMVLANQPELLGATVAAVEAKQPISFALSQRLTLEPGMAYLAYFDLKSVMVESMRSYDNTQSPSLQLSLKELEAQDLPLASYHVDIADGRMSLQLDVPTVTMRELMVLVNELDMRQNEQF